MEAQTQDDLRKQWGEERVGQTDTAVPAYILPRANQIAAERRLGDTGRPAWAL